MNVIADTRPIALFDMQAQQALIRPEIDRRLARVLDSGRFVLGPEVAEFEAAIAAFAGVAHCVGVSSGTDALQIAMMAEGIGPGDAVFLPAFTYTATAEVPLVLGATPVFCDVEADTGNLDGADLERRIGVVAAEGRLRPRALIGVDLYGRPADWERLNAIAARHGLFVIDDAAQAFGAALHGRPLGGWAPATALSFYPTKTLGAYGDAGALLTDDAERAALWRSLRTHGEGQSRYEVLRTGMNGRLDTMQAAILLAKLALFPGELAARARVAAMYNEGLGDVVAVPPETPGYDSAWGLYTIMLRDAAERASVQAALQAARVPSAIYYPKGLHQQPAYAAAHAAALAEPPPLAVSEALCGRVLSLPMHPYLDDGQVARVIAAVRAGV
jgi:dTDP-4-amino-4,6-dideoxygalactose transaminase